MAWFLVQRMSSVDSTQNPVKSNKRVLHVITCYFLRHNFIVYTFQIIKHRDNYPYHYETLYSIVSKYVGM